MKDVITSRQNQTIIKICKLSDKKNREEAKLFRFDGIKLYIEATLAHAELRYVLLRESDCGEVISKIISSGAAAPEKSGAEVLLLSDSLFNSVSEEKSPEGIICVSKYIDKFHKIATIDNNLTADGETLPVEGANDKIIMLEDIRDPGNLGTILRSAAAFGMDCVILAGECADIYNPKTLRAAMGAIFKLKTISYRDGAEAAFRLRKGGRRILAAALDRNAEKLGSFPLRSSDCVVIGNEGHGISKKLMAACDMNIIIPINEGSESLNASAAAAVFMWEIVNSR
jgi:TrmH family RNA methyltransferase